MPILGIMASAMSANLWQPEGAYDSLATVTVPSGGVATITFAGIPTGYKHLQLRALARTNRASATGDYFNMNFNSDSGSNYTGHYLYGNGTTAYSGANGASITTAYLVNATAAGATANSFAANIVDFLDYSNTSKNKTMRSLIGIQNNGSGDESINFNSALWMSTAAINTITITSGTGSTIQQYSSFALYGVK
jgi:hypothetical protein